MLHRSSVPAALLRLALLLGAVSAATAARPLPLEWPELDFIDYRMAYLGASLLPPVPADHVTGKREFLSRAPFLQTPSGLALDLDALPADLASQLAAASAATHQLAAADFQALGSPDYLAARPFPLSTADLFAQQGIPGERWDTVLTDSLITRSTRRIHFRTDVVLEALLDKREVPPGTVFIAEDLGGRGEVLETHVTQMRADYRVDFALYGKDGHRRLESESHPEKFQAPLSCFTCHAKTSQRPSPFWEFPDAAPVQEGFQPKVHESLTPGEARLVHRLWRAKQDSDVFGSYTGLAAIRLKRRAAAGPVPAWASDLRKRIDQQFPSHP